MIPWSVGHRRAYEATMTRRFWSRVDRSNGPEACWLWTGPRNRTGYGKAALKGRAHNAHRVAWILTRGPVAAGLHVDHLCRVKLCCNPAHLEPVTAWENLHRSPITNGNKTRCPQGHPYSGNNLRVSASGRHCRTCGRVYVRRNKARKRAARCAGTWA